MNLYSRPFVRETRARVLDFLRHHPALWNDYKRHRKWFDLPRKQAVSGIRIAWLVAAFLVFLSRSRPDLPLVVLALYCTGTVIFRSRSLRISLYGPGNIAIFNGLPIAEKDFFQIQWKKFIWRSLSLLVIATIVYLSSSFAHLSARSILAAILAGLLQWLLVCSFVLPALRADKTYFIYGALALYGAGILFAVLPANFARYVPVAIMFLPAGWISGLYAGLMVGTPVALLWLIPILVLCAIGVSLSRRVRDSYSSPGVMVNPGMEIDESPESEISQTSEAPLEAPSADEVRDNWLPIFGENRLVSGALNLVPDWSHHGWIENIAGRWLNAREKAIADFTTGEMLGRWSSNWQKAVLVAAASVVLAAFPQVVPPLLSIGAILIATALAAPALGGFWAGFAPVRLSTLQSVVVAFYPVDYWSVSTVMLKVNLVRIAAWSLLITPAVTMVAWKAGYAPAFGLLLSVKLIVCVVAWQFVAIVFKHSRSSNDTTKNSLTMLLFALWVMFWIFAVFFGGLCFIEDLPAAPVLIGGAAVVISCVLGWGFYGFLLNYGRIDLVRVPDKR